MGPRVWRLEPVSEWPAQEEPEGRDAPCPSGRADSQTGEAVRSHDLRVGGGARERRLSQRG